MSTIANKRFRIPSLDLGPVIFVLLLLGFSCIILLEQSLKSPDTVSDILADNPRFAHLETHDELAISIIQDRKTGCRYIYSKTEGSPTALSPIYGADGRANCAS